MNYRKTAMTFERAAHIAAARGDIPAAELHAMRASHYEQAADRAERLKSREESLEFAAKFVVGLAIGIAAYSLVRSFFV